MNNGPMMVTRQPPVSKRVVLCNLMELSRWIDYYLVAFAWRRANVVDVRLLGAEKDRIEVEVNSWSFVHQRRASTRDTGRDFLPKAVSTAAGTKQSPTAEEAS